MENKKKYAIWFHPETKRAVEDIYAKDNCQSQSEFIEKAILFYIDYLNTEHTDAFLPRTLTTMMEGHFGALGDRIGSLLFKVAVEQNVVNNLLAADMELDTATYQRLRGHCIREVKSTNGRVNFQDAIQFQRKA